MGFNGDGDSKAFATIENIYRNEKVTKYICKWGFFGDGDCKASSGGSRLGIWGFIPCQ